MLQIMKMRCKEAWDIMIKCPNYRSYYVTEAFIGLSSSQNQYVKMIDPLLLEMGVSSLTLAVLILYRKNL